LDELAYVLEGLTIEAFSEIVGPLFFGVDFQHSDIPVVDVAPKEVPLDEEILRPVGDALFGGEKKGAVVILEYATTDGRLELRRETQGADDFGEERTKWKQRSHARAEGGVFRLERGE
jgi:hypothetical protein